MPLSFSTFPPPIPLPPSSGGVRVGDGHGGLGWVGLLLRAWPSSHCRCRCLAASSCGGANK